MSATNRRPRLRAHSSAWLARRRQRGDEVRIKGESNMILASSVPPRQPACPAAGNHVLLVPRLTLCAGLLGIVLPPAAGQSYPSRPIRLIVPQGAGGSTDIISRITAQRMS